MVSTPLVSRAVGCSQDGGSLGCIRPTSASIHGSSSEFISENTDDLADIIKQLRESWNNRLSFPLSKLPECYLRGDLTILFHCSAHSGIFRGGKFALSIERDLSGNLGHRGRKNHESARINDDKLPVLIESIHVVDDEKGVVSDIGPSVVRLHFLDQSPNVFACHALYFSIVSFNFFFERRLGLKYRKLDDVLGFGSRLIGGKMPNDMVETGAKVMDNLSSENAKTQRNALASMVINRFLPHLVIWMWKDWIVASLNKVTNFGFEIDDILIGPF